MPSNYFDVEGFNEIEQRPIFLVESEKTSLIAEFHYPQYLFLAVGGANGLTADKAKVLKGKAVTILPDNDKAGIAGAKKTAKLLKSIGCKADVGTFEHSKSMEGMDLADFIEILVKTKKLSLCQKI
mgnify:CR=1 FL=1